jgi:hypothetical protein
MIAKLFTIIILVVVLVVVGGVLSYGAAAPTVEVYDNNMQIKALYGLTVDFSDITQITFVEQSMSEIGVGRRVNGYGGFGDTLKGHFKSDNLGETLLFVNANSSLTIRIENNRKKDIYISFSNGEQTEILFNDLIVAFVQ